MIFKRLNFQSIVNYSTYATSTYAPTVTKFYEVVCLMYAYI